MISYLVSALRTNEIQKMLEVIPGTSTKAIISGHVVPEALQKLNQFIQIYRVTPIMPEDVQAITYRVCCRQRTEANADKLAGLVYEELNREVGKKSTTQVYSICRVLESIYEEQNLYNTVVEVEVMYA